LKITKLLFSALNPWLKNGLAIKIRHAFPSPFLILQSLSRPQSADLECNQDDQIVLIGLGTAALTCLQQLKSEGFRNVKVISRDRLYGGKCVNYGCMPSEFVLAHSDNSTQEVSRLLRDFIAELEADVEQQFNDLGFPINFSTVSYIQANRVVLSNGEAIEFDRLIVAMGNTYPIPPQIPKSIQKLVRIEDFWMLPTGCRIAIYADGNISALSLGDIAKSLGMIPTVLLAGINPIAGLPSYRYFVREMKKRGVNIYEHARLTRVAEDEIAFEDKGKSLSLSYDYLLVASKPVPNFPLIDGALPTIYDIDMTKATLPTRPDIFFLGDGAGLFTAASAEIQAQLLMRHWKYGERLDLRVLDTLPVSLHGVQSLAMVGPEWSFASRKWSEIDFRSIGWTKVYGLEGKLWYILNPETKKIEAFHICHKNAGELICLGSALMEFSVLDMRWMTNSKHPSSAEIFKHVAGKVRETIKSPNQNLFSKETAPIELEFQLPDIYKLHPSIGLPCWLTIEMYNKAITSTRPHDYFLTYYGLWKFRTVADCQVDSDIKMANDNSLIVIRPEGLRLTINHETNSCLISNDNYLITIKQAQE
jgi:pyruvate/2-oxoglutarate dehydrogenase complex dihydrolipoamide dehydrogenase (E3) component